MKVGSTSTRDRGVLRVDEIVAVQYVDYAFSFTMTGLISRKWRQVKRTLWAGLPARLRKGGAQTKQGPDEGGSPHERQNDGQTPASKSTADFLGSSTVAALHRSSPARPVQSLPSGQIVAGRFEILRFLRLCNGRRRLDEVVARLSTNLREVKKPLRKYVCMRILAGAQAQDLIDISHKLHCLPCRCVAASDKCSSRIRLQIIA